MPYGRYDDDGGAFPRYVSAEERRKLAARALARLRKEGMDPQPVCVTTRELATTFWGRAWCDNLEAYADYASRLPRGRSYLRNGSVLDLRIATGEVKALVSGSEVYEVAIAIATLPAARWAAVRKRCAGRIATVVELLSGKLSGAVMEVLCDRDRGLFPAPADIELDCSCPDGARLCKHVAAVLYGV
ncbi:MAG: SWIM zinc finger family protein, partial [Anaeromyxobacteraceae bacterium]